MSKEERDQRVASFAALLLNLVSAEARLADAQAAVDAVDIVAEERTDAEKIVNAVSQEAKAVLAGRK